MPKWMVVALLWSCSDLPAYRCAGDEDCATGTPSFCEETRWCSVGDPACPSEWRYVAEAGDGLSGQCVAATSRCGTTSLLGDDFSEDRRWLWRDQGAARVDGGRLSFNVPKGGLAQRTSVRGYDLRRDGLAVHVTQPPSVFGELVLRARTGPETFFDVALAADGERLLFRERRDGIDLESAGSYHGPTWLRLRDDGHEILWEHSGDGLSWTVGRRRESRADLEYATIELIASAVGAGGQAIATIDEVRGLHGDTRYCPASSLRDGLDGAAAGSAFSLTATEPDCAVEASGDAVTFHTRGAAAGTCGYSSISGYRLAGSSVTVHVRAGVVGGTSAFLTLMDALGRTVSFAARADGLNALVDGSAADAFAAAPDQWWRLRESADEVLWEISTDGQTWGEPVHRASVPLDLSLVNVAFGLETTDGLPGGGEASFEALNDY
jgi:hypothetical protein